MELKYFSHRLYLGCPASCFPTGGADLLETALAYTTAPVQVAVSCAIM